MIVNLPFAEMTISPALAYYPPGASYGPRTLTDFELVWLRTGSAQWHGRGECAHLQLAPGDLLLIPPGTRDEFRWDREVPTRHGYVHFRSAPGPVSAPLLHRGLAHGPVGGLLDFLLWLGETQRPGWEERVGELLAVITQVLTAGPLPEPERPEPAALTAALDYVRREWAVAMRLLARSNLTVSQVEAACGFADPLYFSRRFRAAHGIAPSAYRDNGAAANPPDLPGLLSLSRRLALE